MSQTKDFHIGAVLSITTDTLVAPMGDIYGILNWMTGENLFTHQLPRAGEEARPALLRAHPQLADVTSDGVTPENWRAWLDDKITRFGETLAVPKLTGDEHERIDPISELAEKVHPDRIIVVDPRGA